MISRCLDPSLSENFAEEKWEGFWAMEQLMNDGLAACIYNIVNNVIIELLNEKEEAMEEFTGGLPWISVFEEALELYDDLALTVWEEEMTDIDEEETETNNLSLLHPGGVGEYVAARTILRAIEMYYNNKGWDYTAVSNALRQFQIWGNEETISIEETYRRVGLLELADGMKEETERVATEMREKAFQLGQMIDMLQDIV